MAKKKQQPEPVEKIFEVIPAIYQQLDWPLGWEAGDNKELIDDLVIMVDNGFYQDGEIALKDTILHETLNSFKGNSDSLKAFLFLDTANGGGLIVDQGNAANSNSITPIKGTLIIVKGYDYFVSSTLSKKRRVLELIF